MLSSKSCDDLAPSQCLNWRALVALNVFMAAAGAVAEEPCGEREPPDADDDDDDDDDDEEDDEDDEEDVVELDVADAVAFDDDMDEDVFVFELASSSSMYSSSS